MFFRIRVAFNLALLSILMSSITAFAKGGFSFIAITGPNLKEEVRATNLALTEDFFAFADFFRDRTKAPTDPGTGYEITRYYIDGKREIAFDHLHYYPDTGFVYYDGIVNGSSEYDGAWYTAKPETKAVFEKVLPGGTQSAAPVAESQPITALDSEQTNQSLSHTQSMTLIAVIVGLVIILGFAYRLRKLSTR
jgi:hypothetical protein